MSQRLALATLVAVGFMNATAQAQTTPLSFYGTMDLAVGKLSSQPPGPPNAPVTSVNGVHNGGVQTSYFGLRGTEDLGDGLKAKFQLESFLRADTGASGRFNPPGPPQDPLWSRAAWVGLEGGFGELRLGNNTNPSWLANVFTSAMGSNSLFSPSFRQQYNGSTRGYMAQDTGLSNSLSYSSPMLAGTVVTVNVQASEGTGSGNNLNGSVVHRAGPLLLALAGARVQHVPSPDPAGALDEQFVMLGAHYDLKVVTLFAQYTDFKDKLGNIKIRTPHIGLTAPVGTGQVQLAWAEGKTSGAASGKRTTTSAGYLHPLSRRTQLYLMVGTDKVSTGTAKSYVTGIRHTF
ncbi:porin [Hydrogenophaga luteola]|uniref:Porin n=1 Tax=Hydrogenophaga luteola TaxID=1591122 RepID=A0ABV7W7U3_9BURK